MVRRVEGDAGGFEAAFEGFRAVDGSVDGFGQLLVDRFTVALHQSVLVSGRLRVLLDPVCGVRSFCDSRNRGLGGVILELRLVVPDQFSERLRIPILDAPHRLWCLIEQRGRHRHDPGPRFGVLRELFQDLHRIQVHGKGEDEGEAYRDPPRIHDEPLRDARHEGFEPILERVFFRLYEPRQFPSFQHRLEDRHKLLFLDDRRPAPSALRPGRRVRDEWVLEDVFCESSEACPGVVRIFFNCRDDRRQGASDQLFQPLAQLRSPKRQETRERLREGHDDQTDGEHDGGEPDGDIEEFQHREAPWEETCQSACEQLTNAVVGKNEQGSARGPGDAGPGISGVRSSEAPAQTVEKAPPR